MSWYSGPIRFIGNDPSARGYERYGRKLLGVLEERAEAGVMTGSLRRVMEDGVIIEASRNGAQRTIMVEVPQRGPQQPKRLIPDNVKGFVVWPHAANGDLTLLEDDRIILAMRGDDLNMQAVGRGQYINKFPDGPVYPSLTGAGNVDWEGRGWRLSWYGPRSRYLDNGVVFGPLLFFKGQPLIDLMDTEETTVRGAAVANTPSGDWLILVTTSPFNNARQFFAYKIIGSPDDPAVTLDIGSQKLLGLHNNAYFFESRGHPWFFSPDGLTGKVIGDQLGIVEITVTINIEDGEPDSITKAVETLDVSCTEGFGYTGYTLNTEVKLKDQYHDTRLEKAAVVAVLPPYFDDGLNDGPDGTASVDAQQTTHSGHQFLHGHGPALGSFISYNYTYKPHELTVDGGNHWQKCAVDFNADGVAVYAYARVPTATGTETGTASVGGFDGLRTQVVDDPPFTVEWFSNPLGGGTEWLVNVKHDGGLARGTYAGSAASNTVTTTKSLNQVDTMSGLKFGTMEFVSTIATVENCSSVMAQSISAMPDVSLWGELTIAYQFVSDLPDLLYFSRNNGSDSGISTQTFNANSTKTITKTEPQLIYMDLRHDAVFVATCTQVETITMAVGGSRTYDPTAITLDEFGAPIGDPTSSAVTTDTSNQKVASWNIQGFVDGVQVYTLSLPPAVISSSSGSSVNTEDDFTVSAYASAYTAGATDRNVVDAAGDHDYNQVWSNGQQGPTTSTGGDPFGSGSIGTAAVSQPTVYVHPDYEYITESAGLLDGDVNQYGYMGMSSTPTPNVFKFDLDPTRRARWVLDIHGVPVYSGFSFTDKRWLASFALPYTDGATPQYANETNCIGDVPTMAVIDESAVPAHLFPLWYLEATKMPPRQS